MVKWIKYVALSLVSFAVYLCGLYGIKHHPELAVRIYGVSMVVYSWIYWWLGRLAYGVAYRVANPDPLKAYTVGFRHGASLFNPQFAGVKIVEQAWEIDVDATSPAVNTDEVKL